MKKLLSFSACMIFALICLFSFSLSANAADVASGTCGQNGGTNLSWVLDDSGTLTIGGSGRMADYYDNSASPWTSYNEQIKKVVIGSEVINIGSRAFLNCTNLAEVDFGNIDTIGDHAFMNCSSLKHAFLPSNCTWIWAYAFENCTSLQSAYIDYVNSYSAAVPEGFFKGCTNLAVLGLGTGISSIGTDALANCTSLTAVISDNSSIQSTSYNVVGWSERSGECSNNTYSQTKLTWHFELEEARLYFTGSGDMTGYENGSQPWQAFTGAVNKVDFSTTDGITSISTTAFQGRTAIESVDFTNVNAIGYGAFAECSSLGSVHFDSMLNQIWNYAFANDIKIDTITFTEGSDSLHIYTGAFNNCSGTTFWINLPKNTRYVDDHAFWNTNFNYVEIYSEEITLGDDAFGDGKGGWIQYRGVAGKSTGVHNWVISHQNRGYNWKYFCLGDDHYYQCSTVEPTCTEQGYDSYTCAYCDADGYKENYTDALGHIYKYREADGLTLKYDCERCEGQNISETAYDVKELFSAAASLKAGSLKYKQNNYDGRADLDNDGVINGKDFALINKVLASPDLTGKETTFDINTTYQTIDGFGASAAWWSQYVGTWENTRDILSLLYSKENGIGLNIYRYNLGAGSEDQKDYILYVENARTHCFMNSDGTYNWNNDEGAMNSLSIARQLNPDLKVTLFSNSAPYFMTKNGKTYGALTTDSSGNVKGTENLDSSQFDNFASFVTTCAEHFIDEGYNVTSVSPINEPEWDWSGWYNDDGSQSSNQEGCHFDEATARDFYNNAMIPAITGNSKLNGKVDVEVWECAQLNHSWWWERFMNQNFSTKDYDSKVLSFKTGNGYEPYNRNIRGYVDTVSTHSYWASTADKEAAANLVNNGEFFKNQNLKFRQTEYCQMNTDASTNALGHMQAENEQASTNGMGIDYGLALADIIYQDMTILNATEWDWWTACGTGIYPDSLVYINKNNHSDIQPAKRLWALGNYSKFIEEGAKRISVSTGESLGADLHTDKTYTWVKKDDSGNVIESGVDKNNYLEETAYLNPDGTVVIVYINNSDTTEYTTFTDSNYPTFKSYVTDETRDLKLYQSGKSDGAVCIPAKSVTTVVLKDERTPAVSTDGAYLFSYFTGNAQSEQRIRFAVSKDGYNFSPLNSNNEVITQTKGTLNCRDPYIFKGQDGYYYIIATDMDASTNIWWGNSNTMILWRSNDLVNWSNETVINMSEITGADDIQRCWAPQVFWDEKEQKYLVYFGLASWSISRNVTNMYYCYTDDLLDQSRYSYPQLLYKSATTFVDKNGNTVESSSIDGDIFYDSKSKTYYLYYKDEGTATICYVTSKNLTGPYGDASNPTKVINSDVGLEGCNAHFITGTNTLVMLADAYGDGYFVMNQSTDFRNFYMLRNGTYTINNCTPRHGSVVAISDSEYDRLVSQFGL